MDVQSVEIGKLNLGGRHECVDPHGKQQGSKKGCNHKKRGRLLHHLLIAFVAELKMVANFWLGHGNSNTNNNILTFLQETFDVLEGKTIGLFKAESGFYSKDVMEWLEDKQTYYVIAVKMYSKLRDEFRENAKWVENADDIWVGELVLKAKTRIRHEEL